MMLDTKNTKHLFVYDLFLLLAENDRQFTNDFSYSRHELTTQLKAYNPITDLPILRGSLSHVLRYIWTGHSNFLIRKLRDANIFYEFIDAESFCSTRDFVLQRDFSF